MKKFKYLIIISVIILNVSVAYAGSCAFHLFGKCYDCNTEYILKVGTQDNCEEKCPNRIYIAKDRTCRLKIGNSKTFTRPSNTSISSDYCETYEDITYIEVKEKNENGEKIKVKKEIITIRNSGDNTEASSGIYFKGENGKCYKCNALKPVKVSSDNCDGYFCHKDCGERIVKHHDSPQTLYSVYKCPKDRPLMDRFMMCWSCSEPSPIDLSFDKSFNSQCPGRTMSSTDPFSYK